MFALLGWHTLLRVVGPQSERKGDKFFLREPESHFVSRWEVEKVP